MKTSFLTLAAAFTAATLHAQTWTVTYLTPDGAFNSAASAYATTGTRQVGYSGGHATIWSGTAASPIDLHPDGGVGATASGLNAINGTQQAGYATIGGTNHAGIWAGTKESFVDLHPDDPNVTYSIVQATSGTQQAGNIMTGGVSHGGIWAGGKASFLDLNPDSSGATASGLNATTGTQQAGYATIGGSAHAGIWAGTKDSFVDLHPYAADAVTTASVIRATTGAQQAGRTVVDGVSRAAIWAGSKGSFVDLHPESTGATSSYLYDTNGTQQAGYAIINGASHAGIWTGTAGSFIDLHVLLPADYSTSEARSVWTDGATILVAGSARNSVVNRTEAVVWKMTPKVVPPPKPAAPVVKIIGAKNLTTAKAKLTIKGSATGPVTSVTYRIGSRPAKAAKGTAKWSLKAALKPGKNKIAVTAHGPGGDSAPARVTVMRKP